MRNSTRLETCLLVGGLALALGCEGGTTKPVQPKIGQSVNSPAPEDDILPPQSEPPVGVADPEGTVTKEPDEATPAEPASKVHVLFDGKSLDQWKISNYGGEGRVEVEDGAVVMQQGADLTGISWDGDPLPKINYEVSLAAQRIEGSDFFCGIVFPVNEEFCSFVAGGWGGSTIGLSSVDGMYAAENETGTYNAFEEKTWYKFRLRVSEHAITAWIDGKQFVHLRTKDRKLSLHPLSEPGKPFGLSCFRTVAGMKDIELRELTEKEIAADVLEEK